MTDKEKIKKYKAEETPLGSVCGICGQTVRNHKEELCIPLISDKEKIKFKEPKLEKEYQECHKRNIFEKLRKVPKFKGD